MTDTGRRPTTRPGTRTATGRVRLAPPSPPTPVPDPPPPAPWWWSILAGLLAGLLAVGVGLLITAGKMQPDPFAMALIGSGIALVAGANVRAVTRAALGPVARAIAASAEKDGTP